MAKSNIVMENARLIFRNFEGREEKYNRKGDRNFGLIIEDPEVAQQLAEDGWNIKELTPKNNDDYDDTPEVIYWLPVTVRFDNVPPKVMLVTRRKKTRLNEDNINTIDYANIAKVDLTVTPYDWEVNGKSGTKAYLQTMYVTINEDEFADKYADLEEA
jgi:hypothetical protein|nr:MAG TPA: hypothetical protein [Caudoviricetes sp.]